MKKILKISYIIPFIVLGACEMSQPPAKVEYHLEDYYGYGDVQGPPTQGSKADLAIKNKGVPVIIQDVSKNDISMPEKSTSDNATQVYTVSDNVGPVPTGQSKIIRNPTTSETSEVNISAHTHTVSKGDTLFSISRQYNVPILPIIVANSLQAPYALNEGQQIKIPEGKFHDVGEGETLYSISRKYGVDMSGIVKLNNLKQPYNVVKGQRLQIPFPTDLPKEEAVAENSNTEPKPLISEAVQARPSVISPEDAGKPASLRKPTGGVLGVYDTAPKNDIKAESKPDKPIDTEVETAKLANNTEEIKTPQKEIPVINDGKFMWPVQGKIVKNFGQQGGEYNDGINIAASAGTQVKASNAGRVVYTGNSLKSYGNLVIIKHDNGLLSAYAHMNDVIVAKDQQIKKGQAIGTVGSTGKVTSPQLYFAIRKGKDAKNPMNYLQ